MIRAGDYCARTCPIHCTLFLSSFARTTRGGLLILLQHEANRTCRNHINSNPSSLIPPLPPIDGAISRRNLSELHHGARTDTRRVHRCMRYSGSKEQL
jgi:hypothetical protein